MEQPPALTPEQLTAAQRAHHSEIGEPQTVKIFGILHLVFALFGTLSIQWELGAPLVVNKLTVLTPTTPETAAQAEMDATLEDKFMIMSITTDLIAVVVTILMVMAGIKLLKKKRDGLKSSNRYAYASLAAKAIAVVFTFAVMLPAIKDQMPSGSAGSAMGIAMISGAIGGILISCIYPVLTLVLLNRPATKDWFANRPE